MKKFLIKINLGFKKRKTFTLVLNPVKKLQKVPTQKL
jgi:hypothetical protein